MKTIHANGYYYEMEGGRVVGLRYMSEDVLRVDEEVYVSLGDGIVPSGTKGKIVELFRAFQDDASDNTVNVLCEGHNLPLRFKAFHLNTPQRWKQIRGMEAQNVVTMLFDRVRLTLEFDTEAAIAVWGSADRRNQLIHEVAVVIEKAFKKK